MSVESWEHYFKPEVRSSGRAFITKDKVALSQPSDTEIVVYIRGSSSFKVTLKSKTVSDPLIAVECTCPQSKKGQFCKHIWAALLTADEKSPDFFESKKDIQKRESVVDSGTKQKVSAGPADAQKAYQQKQADYRKQQYQKQKQRLKDIKKSKKSPAIETEEFPVTIEKALKYFLDNGFPLRETMNLEAISFAKKKLARLFHPDLGGSHDEILELNRHSETLSKFIKT